MESLTRGRWIWKSATADRDEYVVFSDSFISERKKATMLISVAGDYVLKVNGKTVAFGQYADYVQYKVFDEVDLTPYLTAGKNEIRILCWYIGESFSVCRKMQAGLFYEITDGERILACSHAGVLCALAPDYVSGLEKTITPQLGYSYRYDTRYTDRNPEWEEAVETEGYSLSPRPVRKLEYKERVQGKLLDGKKKIYDLGRECSGYLFLRFKAEEGKLVRIAYGEHIADGTVRYEIANRNFTVELVGSGKTEEFKGYFRRLGCRYLQILDEAEIEEIGVEEWEYPVKEKSYPFEDPLREKIYKTCVRTLRLCMHEHYEDCPWREQSMYIMDSLNQVRSGFVAFEGGNAAFVKAAILMIAEGQKESGLFELCFPAEVPITIPAFSLMFPVLVAEYEKFTGDLETVERVFKNAERTMNYFLSRRGKGGLYETVYRDGIWNFYEWVDDLDGALFFNPAATEKPKNNYDCIINAYLSLACAAQARLCRMTGRGKEAEKYFLLSGEINKSIYKVFYNPEKGLFRTHEGTESYSVLGNSLCVLCGACPEEERAPIADKLAYGFDGWVENTLSTEIFRYDALLSVNKEKYGEAILNRIDETYGYMLRQGATSFWETIKGSDDFEGAGSLCHGWSAIPVYYYHLLGIIK